MNLLGTLVLHLTFAITVIALIMIIFMKRPDTSKTHPGVILGLISCSGVLLTSILLLYCLVRGIFSVEFVYHNTETSLPVIYKISAFWSGSAGSLLLWTTCFALVLFFIDWRHRQAKENRTVFGVILFFMALFLVMICFINNPFRQATPKTDGFGLNPALQSLGMVFHPPIVLLGFAFFFTALAYAFHDLRNAGENHQDTIRNWTLWGWVLLTVGIVSGGLWAYTELGWGGYWAWDPIENSSLVNWLLATVFLHRLGRKDYNYRHQKGNFIVIALTVFSILLGTFIARSGILKSVHAYSSQKVLYFLGGWLILLALITIVIIFWYQRKNKHTIQAEIEVAAALEAKWHQKILKPMNWLVSLLLIMAILVFGGTVLPLFGIQTPPEFYNYTFGCLGLILLLILGVCPSLFPNRKSNLLPGVIAGIIVFFCTAFNSSFHPLTIVSLSICSMLIINLLIAIFMNRRYYFANRNQFSFFMLHAAILLMAIGITGSKGITEGKEQVFRFNDTMRLKNYSITYRELQWRYEKGKTVAIATIDVLGKQGRETFKPELAYYQKRDMNHSRAVVKAGLWEDLYIIFEGLDESGQALFRVMVLRWVSLVWLGGLCLTTGTILRFGWKPAG
jgi:cytochrome c-type biogenesis protein CcmF